MGKLKTTKKLNRKCLVCGKKINITLCEDKHYRSGHYFGTLKVPLKGKGEYKKIGTDKLFGKKVNIVKWVGKEKELEYWECDSCYDEAIHEYWLENIIEKLYGKRCTDYEKGCACCQAWDLYNTIIDSNRGRL